MFIVSLTYIKPLEQIDAFIPQHVAFLDKYYDLGVFQLSGRKEPRTGGVIIASATSKAALEDILLEDPFQREGLATYEIIEVTPTKSAEPLAYLLS